MRSMRTAFTWQAGIGFQLHHLFVHSPNRDVLDVARAADLAQAFHWARKSSQVATWQTLSMALNSSSVERNGWCGHTIQWQTRTSHVESILVFCGQEISIISLKPLGKMLHASAWMVISSSQGSTWSFRRPSLRNGWWSTRATYPGGSLWSAAAKAIEKPDKKTQSTHI